MGRRSFIRVLRDRAFLLRRGAQSRRALLATTASVDHEQIETLRANIVANRASVEEQGAVLKSLKTSQKVPPQVDVDAAVETLTQFKVEPTAAAKEFSSQISNRGVSSSESFRAAVNNTLERRLFIIPSFAIYGGVTGLYDYGPPGCAIKANVLAFWRQHFVLEENMLEVDCPCVTPEVVLKASGHVDKFTDLMVKDEKTGMCYRADHLLKDYCKEALEKDPLMDSARRDQLKEVLATIDELSAEQLGQKLKEYGIVAPDSKNPLSDPYPFNLMFSTLIGPTGIQPGYLRPETAQGIFVNFKDLYYYNGNKLPFAAAQIGQAFRNEIAPRQGLLRVREFTLAEIEHFVNPDDKNHPKFNEVAELSLLLYPREEQLAVKKPVLTCLGEAVGKGLINNETLGYFIGRTYLFLTMLGIDKTRLRFRQHLPNEMAHYAADCWDAEIECSYGWIECVGLADRSAFDLKAHTEKSKIELAAQERFSEPREIEQLTILPIKKEIGSAFRNAARKVEEALMVMSEAEALDLQSQLNSKGQVDFTVCTLGKDVTITNKMVSIFKETKKVHSRTYTPNVIEPSFGIGRIIYCLYEHCFYMRPSKSGEEQCNVFSFPPFIAPIKCTVFPLVQQERFNVVALQISKALSRAGVSYKIDTTGTSIGKRYARTDELGVPFAITVDSDTTVTIRERDSKEQARVPIDEVALVVKELVESFISWEGVKSKYPLEASKE